MSVMSIKEFSKAAWSEAYNRIIGAAVFLDDASAECLHWEGGLFNLLSGGAACVKALSPFEFCSSDYKKAVFITQATSVQLSTVREIIRNSDFTHCILLSTVSLDTLFLELNDGENVSDVLVAGKAVTQATKQLEGMLLEWIDKKQSAVEVIHTPITTISLSNIVFLTPPFCNVYPSYDGKLIPDSPSVDLYTLTSEERSQVRRLASGLNSLFDTINIKEDIYYMGTYSSLIAGVLENSPVCLARRKVCTNPATLILIDRTLDLCGVTSHSSESLLDKIMSVLPRFPGHSTDVAVDVSPLCEANIISVTEDSQLSPGCIYHADDESCYTTFDHMMNKTQKEVMFDLYNKLSKIDVLKSPGLKTLLKVTPQSVEKIINASKGNYNVIEQNLGLLQQALAVVQTLKSPQHSQLELIMNLEKQVLQNIATSRESTSVLTQMCHLIKTRKDRRLPINRLLALLVHTYSLIGHEIAFSLQHEQNLKDTLAVAIFEDHKELFSSSLDGGHIVTPEECEGIAGNIIDKLKDVAQMRRILSRYSSVVSRGSGGAGVEYRGVLQQLAEELAHGGVTDLRHTGSGLKDIIRTGFSMLTSKKPISPKHPMDNQTVIIYVVGGITADECKRLHHGFITSGADNTLIIGSNKLVTPVEAAKDVLRL